MYTDRFVGASFKITSCSFVQVAISATRERGPLEKWMGDLILGGKVPEAYRIMVTDKRHTQRGPH